MDVKQHFTKRSKPKNTPELDLAQLLKDSPKDSFVKTDEDQEWMDAKPVGNEEW